MWDSKKGCLIETAREDGSCEFEAGKGKQQWVDLRDSLSNPPILIVVDKASQLISK